MGKFKVILIMLLIVGVVSGGTTLYFFWDRITFNPSDRYSSTHLNYMDVIYENRSDVYAFNEGYSVTNTCPWGSINQGINYYVVNNSRVNAAAPGRIITSVWREYDDDRRWKVGINIRYNLTVTLSYVFEPWTQKEEDADKQLLMFKVKKGDWVEQGQEIARFFYVNEGAHIHFEVIEKREKSCPKKYFSPEGYREIMELIHSFHPDWELCYPGDD
jgi:hypothetical protein